MSQPSGRAPAKKDRLLGYPVIEKLIESEDFKTVNQSISNSYDTLERMLKNKAGGLKKQKAIRQALKAFDLTIDLIRTLLKTKYDMIADHNKKTPNSGSPQKK